MAPGRSVAASKRAVDRSDRSGSTAMVLLVALVLVGAALFFLALGRERAYPYVVGLLSVLSVAGVFSLFAYAAGIMRFTTEDSRNDFTKALVDGQPDPTLVTEPGGRVIYANPAYLELTSATGGDDVKAVERAFTGDPQIAEAVYRLSQAAREGRRHQEEIRQSTGDTARWFRMRVRSLVEPGVRPPPGVDNAVVWSIADITRDRENAETAFETLQKAIDFLDHAPAGFFSMEPGGEITYMNATLAGWLDHDLAQVGSGGLSLTSIVAGDGASLIGTMAPTPGEVKTQAFDLDLRKRGGQTLPVRLIHKVSYAADGTVGASRTLVLNRTTRDSDGADSLRAAEVRFARFFNNSPLGIATVDRDGAVGRANPLFAKLIGELAHAGEDARSILAIVREPMRAALLDSIRHAAAGRADAAPVEASFVGDQTRFGRFFVVPVGDTDHPGEVAIVYLVETTEQHLLQEQFAQSQKMNAVGQLAGGVAHDFNNVLQAIIGHADLLLMNHRPVDPSFNDIMQIKQNANRAASLVRQLLAFSRKQTLRPQVVQLGEVLSDLSMLLRRSLGERVTLDVVHGRDLWPIKADVTQLEQVILNLAVNARDAMPDGGKLTIRTSNVLGSEVKRYEVKDQAAQVPSVDHVMIEVTDTGTGIPPEIIGKIFDPFFSTKDVGKGTGLGLSTVYGIVKQSGGYVFVDSASGRGTTFRIMLPRYDEAAEPEVISPDPAPTTPGAPAPLKATTPSAPAPVPSRDDTGNGIILLVEDEESVRMTGSRILTSRGYTVLEAASGVEALEVIKEVGGRIDLVVSDVVMPEMNGPTLLRELRKTNPDMKVIFVSGYAEDAFAKDLPEGEVFAFLPKPFSLKQLIDKVKEQLQA
jgi:two-component system cell cycle sensor histidine kinase/response regulator CckA